MIIFVFFKQQAAYERHISDWSSDVCSSDLIGFESPMAKVWNLKMFKHIQAKASEASMMLAQERGACPDAEDMGVMERFSCKMAIAPTASISIICGGTSARSEEHTSELQSLMRISYAVFCLKKNK